MSSTEIKKRASLARLSIAGRAMLLLLPLILFSACRQDMHDQPRYKPLRPSAFFDDGRSARVPVEGTIARGQLREDSLYYTGRTGQGAQAVPTGAATGAAQTAGAIGAQTATGTAAAAGTTSPSMQGFATTFPFPITPELVNRGEERFNIYCSVCHDRTGSGLGMVVRRGYRRPPALYIDRLRQAPAGYLFDVITNGFGAMPDYSAQIPPRDRWAIVAYIRALQLANQGTIADVPEQDRSKIGTGQQPQGGQHR
ncbi:MAG TPA: cytochrome c [Blastocatellia bacterium]|nr:cytochrome c [Blastocatellia bacterium]